MMPMETDIPEDFLKTVGDNYNEIKNRFNNICYSHNTILDSDIFHNTILKCSETVDHKMKLEELCRYLYSAYNTNVLREHEYARNKKKLGSLDELCINHSDENYSSKYIEYTTDINTILDNLYNVFDKEIIDLYLMKIKGYTFKEISKLTKCKSLNYHFSKIEDYINKTYK